MVRNTRSFLKFEVLHKFRCLLEKISLGTWFKIRSALEFQLLSTLLHISLGPHNNQNSRSHLSKVYNVIWFNTILIRNAYLLNRQKKKQTNWHTTELQPFTKYLRLTLVFMLNSTLREKFNFCFLRVFC